MSSIRSIITLALAAASTVNAHAYFHKAYVNGADQGQFFGVRVPQSNSPIQDVKSSAITCNTGLRSPVSTDVIKVAPGDTFGMQWNHLWDGPQGAGDTDDPIAPGHKGPIMAYMAKVSDASTNDGSGLSWFKVAEEGFDTTTRKWAVDTMIAGNGLWSFKVPNLAPGDYLMRGELLALHGAYASGEAQFYMSCVAIRVTGSGTCSPSDTVSFPGAYSASDPGILINIYGNAGQPDNGGKTYTIPGPPVATCDGSTSPSSSTTGALSTRGDATTTSASASVAATTSTSASAAASSTSAAASSTSKASTSATRFHPIFTRPTGTGAAPTSAPISFTATPTTAIAIPTTSPSTTTAQASSSAPVAATSATTSSVAPVSFTSTVTGRIGKPTKFTCYVEE